MSSVVVPNESKQGELRSLLIAMIALPTIIVAVRLWSRYLSSAMSMSKALSRFWWDDWTALAAAVGPFPEQGKHKETIAYKG
jgi:hypothetical protein